MDEAVGILWIMFWIHIYSTGSTSYLLYHEQGLLNMRLDATEVAPHHSAGSEA